MRMRRKWMAVLMSAAMALGAAGCGSEAAATGTQTTSGKTETTTTAAAAKATTTAAATTKTAKTTAASQSLSGEVTVYMPSPSGLNQKYVEDFQNKTGVTVNLFEGTTGEILARLEAEKDNPQADVVVLASWSDGLSFKNTGVLETYTPANADKVYSGWIDTDNQLFGTSASAVGVIYNTSIIDSLDADWTELANPQYQDDLAIPDPEKSGSCKDFLAGFMSANQDNGWDTLQSLADNGLTVAGANKAALETVTTGEKAILVAGVDYNAYSSKDKGEPIDIYYPASGTVINPRPAMILKTAKNMDNAKAFVDYLLSDSAQQLVADAYLLPGRMDITTDKRTNVKDIPTLNYNWSWMMNNADDIASRLNDICGK